MITPENLILLVAGALAVLVAAKLFAQPRTPAAAAPPPTVTARVVAPPPMDDPIALMATKLHHAIEAKGIALAFDRKANEMIEAQAKAVVIPWAAPPAPPAAEAPKA